AVHPPFRDIETFPAGNFQKLLEERPDLPRRLGVNAEPPASVEIVIVFIGVAPGAHEQEKIALMLLAEEILARLTDFLRPAAKEKIPSLGQRGHERDRTHATARVRLEQHAG